MPKISPFVRNHSWALAKPPNRPALSLVSKEFHTFKVVFPGKSGQL
jgi:hypothetical protein